MTAWTYYFRENDIPERDMQDIPNFPTSIFEVETHRNEHIREHLLNLLRKNSEVELMFRKVDGSDRTMFATLKEDAVEKPKNPPKEDDTPLVERRHQKVFDAEKQAWRQFSWDTLVYFIERT